MISYSDIFSNRVADRFRTEQRLKQKLNEDFNSEGVSWSFMFFDSKSVFTFPLTLAQLKLILNPFYVKSQLQLIHVPPVDLDTVLDSPSFDPTEMVVFWSSLSCNKLNKFTRISCPGFHRIIRWCTIKFIFCSFRLVTTAPVAQWIARWTSNPKVVGSSPTWGKFFSINVIETWYSRTRYGMQNV